MVQKPRNRRSKATREPVTIDLEASPVETAPKAGKSVPEAEPVAFDAMVQAATTTAGADAAARDAVESGERPTHSATSESPKPKAAAPSTKARGFDAGGLTWLGGGVIGGIVALLLAALLQWAGLLPSMRGAQAVDLTPMQDRLDTLSAVVETLKTTAPTGADEITARIEGTESAVATIDQLTGTLQADLDAVKQQLDTLNRAVSSGSAGEGAGLEAIATRADALEASVTELSARIDTLDAGSGGVDSTLSGELDTVAQTAKAASEGVAALRGELETLSSSLSEAQSQIAAFGGRLTKVESDIEAGAGSRVAAAIAASALKSAADRGAGFMSELEAYAAVSADEDTVAALRDYAASGVPTPAQLVERFPAVANRIIASSNGLGADAGIVDRLSASARSLVQIRPVGEVEGTEPGAVTARMEVALREGDFERAIGEWETLPEAARTASMDFVDDLRARRDVDTLISRVLSGAMAAGNAETGQSE